MSEKAVTILAFMITGLLIVVVLVGLYRGLIEVAGVVSTLAAVLTGIIAGQAYTKGRQGGGGE
jgi:uncharacterized membrane protein required for colicin V production